MKNPIIKEQIYLHFEMKWQAYSMETPFCVPSSDLHYYTIGLA